MVTFQAITNLINAGYRNRTTTTFKFGEITYSTDRNYSDRETGIKSYREFNTLILKRLEQDFIEPNETSTSSAELNKLREPLSGKEYQELTEKFTSAIYTFYAKELGIDLDDNNTDNFVKTHVIESIIHSLKRQVAFFQPLISSTPPDSERIKNIDLKGELINEPEFEEFKEFADLPGGLIEKFYRGLHRKHTTSANVNAHVLTARMASLTHPDLVAES